MEREYFEQFLCSYRDEAPGAKPISLVVDCENIRVKVSSNYFIDQGVKIFLSLNEKKMIRGIRLGDKISSSLESLKKGMEISPLGLFAAHVLQVDANFSMDSGGLVRFGYLKKIISIKTLCIGLNQLFQRILKRQRSFNEASRVDVIKYWSNQYGENNWGVYVANVVKDRDGIWRLYPLTGDEGQNGPAQELIATFKVNRVGFVLGIETMHASYCS